MQQPNPQVSTLSHKWLKKVNQYLKSNTCWLKNKTIYTGNNVPKHLGKIWGKTKSSIL